MMIIVACKGQRGGDGSTHAVNGSPRPMAGLLRETNYASLTTRYLTVSGLCPVQNTSLRPSGLQPFSSVQLEHGDQVKANRLFSTAYTEFSIMSV